MTDEAIQRPAMGDLKAGGRSCSLSSLPWPEGGEALAGRLQRKTLHRVLHRALHRALNELLAEREDHGVQEFILLTAHRHEPHLDALLMAMPSSASTTVVNLYPIAVGDLPEGSPLSEHAGELETSLMLYLAPDRVGLDQATDEIPDAKTYRKYARGGVATPPPGSRGTLGIPTRASGGKRWGRPSSVHQIPSRGPDRPKTNHRSWGSPLPSIVY
jgi:hypothetical protein